jgi:hypothetical protein
LGPRSLAPVVPARHDRFTGSGDTIRV